jgi:hypothetical protein
MLHFDCITRAQRTTPADNVVVLSIGTSLFNY